MDLNQNGVQDPGEPGLVQIPYRIRYRSGQISNVLGTDAAGSAVFSELFPLFNWYVVESDTTRFKGQAYTLQTTRVDLWTPLPRTREYSIPQRPSHFPAIGRFQEPSTRRARPLELIPARRSPRAFRASLASLNMWTGARLLPSRRERRPPRHVIYASTRPFDDPNLGFQNTWNRWSRASP